MSDLHKAYLQETGGRKISYDRWLEFKLGDFAVAYDNMLDLIQECHRTLRRGTPEQRLALADEIAVGLKETGLFDDVQPAETVKQ